VAGYRLENRVGAGGTAVVFRARDERLDRTVALKILSPALGVDDEFRRRFIRESRAAAAVDHPHIIPVYAAGEAGDMLFIAMRFIAGGDLHSVLHREGPLSATRTAAFISPVASALDAAHAAGLVHRDVKPGNILVDTSPGRPDHPYLSDFGLSKGTLFSDSLTVAGRFFGTPDYSAPEQIGGKPVDVRTDQYALACVTYTLLTGKMPFARDEPMAVLWAHMSDPPPSVTALRPDLSAAVDEVLHRALAKSPQDRFGSCGEFADALRGALGIRSYSALSGPLPIWDQPTGEITTPTGPPAAPSVPVKHRRRSRAPRARHVAIAAGIAVIAAIGAVAGAFLIKPSGSGANWQKAAPIDPGAHLTGVSCPTAGFCVATDSRGNVSTYSGGAWSAPMSIGTGNDLDGVSCASASFCAVVTTGATAYIDSGGRWTSRQLTGADGGPASLTAVSCPAAGYCVAVGGSDGYEYKSGAWSHGAIIEDTHSVTAVSCPTAAFCMAVDNDGNAYTGSRGVWSFSMSIGAGNDLDGVSCASASFCAAVPTGTTAYIDSGGTWTSRQLKGEDGGPAHLIAVSCPADGDCVAVGSLNIYQYSGGRWSPGDQMKLSHFFTSVSCPAVSFCAAVDNDGNAYLYTTG
jgi:serine/threonine-protein kinase